MTHFPRMPWTAWRCFSVLLPCLLVFVPGLAAAEPAYLEAYPTLPSCVAGQTQGLHVSTRATSFNVEVSRIGAVPVSVWRREGVAGASFPVPADASSRGCGWPVAVRVPIDRSWRSGYYQARLTAKDAQGKPTEAVTGFVVRSRRPGRDTRILLQLSMNTYNAYNNYGGYSLYAYNGRDGVQGRRVSFQRPHSTTLLFQQWELPFIQWAEKEGYELDYAVNEDLEFHPEILRRYRLVLSVGHDEYWSSPMRDHLEAYIGRGGNVAFFSGNSVCWQVRAEDRGAALTCWKQAFREDPLYKTGPLRLLSSLWSHHDVKRPENGLTGVGFLHGGYHKSHGQLMDGSGAFTVHRPGHWILEGTGLQRGDAFGGADTVVGYECDGCEMEWREGVPYPTLRDGTPRGFEIVCTAPAQWHPDDCEWYERWEKGHKGHAVVGTYQRGGTVVTVGTTDWSHGLRGRDPAVMRITRNVMDRLGR